MTLLLWVLGAGWGACAAVPVVVLGRRGVVHARVIGSSDRRADGARLEHVSATVARLVARVGGPASVVVRDVLRRRRARTLDAVVARELPVALDLLGVAVDAGGTPFLAVETTARWGPPTVAATCSAVRRACALGSTFERALDDAAGAVPRLRSVADALLVSDRLGAPVAPALARLASEERTALRRRAEMHARRVPVRLLFPLVFLVLPAFVLLTVVPGLASGLSDL
ncbi:MAG: type II secretion system F family protein [Acidimicrobiia bacterium]